MNAKQVCAVFILREDGAAMLQHRDDIPTIKHPGKWTIPGGHRDGEEPLEHCARREVLEETGYRVGALHPLARFPNDDGDGEVYEVILYWTPYDGQEFECLEGQAVRFVRREEIGTLPFLTYLLPYWDQANALIVW